MACFHPLKAYKVGVNPLTGKDKLWIRPYDEKHNLDYVEIPCGKCIGCRLEYSRQWANRMMLELEYHNDAYFITLTYDNDYIPRSPVLDNSTGEYLYDSFSLRKRDIQTFFKHLRKHFPDCKIRYYAAGEYGSTTIRPHYHAIVYGLVLDDLTEYKRSPQGDVLYNSKAVSDCWSNFVGFRSDGTAIYDPIGYVVIGKVTWETCAYVARYVTKKMSGPLGDWFVSQNMEVPFSLMSRKPGLGAQWYYDNPDCMDFEYINLMTEKKGLKFRPPKYFEKLYEIDYPDRASERSDQRRLFAESAKAMILKSTGKSYLEYLSDKEANLKARLKVLDRSEI